MFDGKCDKTRVLQTLYGSMDNDVKWLISSSGRYMFVRLETFVTDVVSSSGDYLVHSSKGFLANIHYGKRNYKLKIFKRI